MDFTYAFFSLPILLISCNNTFSLLFATLRVTDIDYIVMFFKYCMSVYCHSSQTMRCKIIVCICSLKLTKLTAVNCLRRLKFPLFFIFINQILDLSIINRVLSDTTIDKLFLTKYKHFNVGLKSLNLTFRKKYYTPL